jgi:hypothetical protein
MATLYALFPDARESGTTLGAVYTALAAWNGEHYDHQLPFRRISFMAPILALYSVGATPPDDMLLILKSIDWAYPARLVYREETERNWSFVTLGLSLREELA